MWCPRPSPPSNPDCHAKVFCLNSKLFYHYQRFDNFNTTFWIWFKLGQRFNEEMVRNRAPYCELIVGIPAVASNTSDERDCLKNCILIVRCKSSSLSPGSCVLDVQYHLLTHSTIYYSALCVPHSLYCWCSQTSVFSIKGQAAIFRHVDKSNYSFAGMVSICLLNVLRYDPISWFTAAPFPCVVGWTSLTLRMSSGESRLYVWC